MLTPLKKLQARLVKAKELAAAGDPRVTDAVLATLRTEIEFARKAADAEAGAATPEPTSGIAPAASVLPTAAKYAAGIRSGTFSPKVLTQDGARFLGMKSLAINIWNRTVRRLVSQRRKAGEVRGTYINAVMAAIAWLAGRNQGVATISTKELAREADCCKNTARLAIRWLEDHGLLRTLNNVARDEKDPGVFWYERNSYFPRTPIEGANDEAPKEDPAIAAPSPYERAAVWLAELTPFFRGLTARALGFNTSPERREQPAPT